MSGPQDAFQTSVESVHGLWPALPSLWSYSSLSEAEECPRRWALRRARYPDLWEHEGYPPGASYPQLQGSVAHGALEVVLRAFQAQGCTSVSSPSAVQALKNLGGLSRVLEETIATELEALRSNPRAAAHIESVRQRLAREIPAARERLQATISRMRLHPAVREHATGAGKFSRAALPAGSHSEVTLRAEELRLIGRADLVTVGDGGCVITDYKTGEPSERHAEQLRLYALLWSRDGEANPDGLPADSLIVAYPTGDETLVGPSAVELEALAAALTARVASAQAALSQRPAAADPAPQVCSNCGVRQLCDEYWRTSLDVSVTTPEPQMVRFVDCEAVIASRNGPRSWLLSFGARPGQALLRTTTETPAFAAGDSVRLLGLAASTDEASGERILTMTQFSEAFVLRERARSPGIFAVGG